MMRRRLFLGLPLLAMLPAMTFGGEGPPTLRIRSARQLPQPLPAPYDSTANARRDIAAATARAKKRKKPLLLDFGANWCVDCRVLAGVFELPEMKAWIARNFELVQIDVGQFDRNLDIPKRYGLAQLEAVPAVLVIDARIGKLRNVGEEIALGDARIMQPQSIADWLARWTI
ncbi:thioredoxin family protein [Sphingomonas sp. AOB5]|uniref:thioredoxin family protein n=1 Tax=Sphingomonas sp. AOB5 TaxID=3034017 RepID=UPI0023F74D22|nr:thioredoxin family protein [Sphingomonas sp. AOB5]MDF7777070.1 thioredoxin family protein [Sphingomonas sp. AOB5]